jgi:hypothetical protein
MSRKKSRKRNKQKTKIEPEIQIKPDELKDSLRDYKEYQIFLKQFINYQKMIYENDINIDWTFKNVKLGRTK